MSETKTKTETKTKLEKCTEAYWTASFAWNTSAHPKVKPSLTVATGLKLLEEARQGSNRLNHLSSAIVHQIVHHQAEPSTQVQAQVRDGTNIQGIR